MTQITFDHNIDSLMSDIDDVKDDLRHEMRKRVGSAMRVLWADVKQYVLDDPNTSGDLFSSISRDTDVDRTEIEFSVYSDASLAPYAAIVEYGSGRNTNVSWRDAPQMPRPDLEDTPPGYPFSAPDIDNVNGFAYYIEQWMRAKGIQPKYGSYRQSSLAIAGTIVDRGTYAHPYMRPAWFDNELKVKRAAKNALKNAVR